MDNEVNTINNTNDEKTDILKIFYNMLYCQGFRYEKHISDLLFYSYLSQLTKSKFRIKFNNSNYWIEEYLLKPANDLFKAILEGNSGYNANGNNKDTEKEDLPTIFIDLPDDNTLVEKHYVVLNEMQTEEWKQKSSSIDSLKNKIIEFLKKNLTIIEALEVHIPYSKNICQRKLNKLDYHLYHAFLILIKTLAIQNYCELSTLQNLSSNSSAMIADNEIYKKAYILITSGFVQSNWIELKHKNIAFCKDLYSLFQHLKDDIDNLSNLLKDPEYIKNSGQTREDLVSSFKKSDQCYNWSYRQIRDYTAILLEYELIRAVKSENKWYYFPNEEIFSRISSQNLINNFFISLLKPEELNNLSDLPLLVKK